MSLTEERFASIDQQLAHARAAWEEERKQLEAELQQLRTELAIRTRLHDDAIAAKDAAMQTTIKLLTQFGIVAQVFDDAKQLAINAGLYTSAVDQAKKPDDDRLTSALAAIDSVTKPEETT